MYYMSEGETPSEGNLIGSNTPEGEDLTNRASIENAMKGAGSRGSLPPEVQADLDSLPPFAEPETPSLGENLKKILKRDIDSIKDRFRR
jgi:hypothetical protein